jgi:hypothetical protein
MGGSSGSEGEPEETLMVCFSAVGAAFLIFHYIAFCAPLSV